MRRREISFCENGKGNHNRNDLYLTVEQGYFDRSGKARNVEVSVVVIGKDGRVIEDEVFFAAGLQPASKVSFPVLFHSNSPVWHETVRLQIPIERFEGAHIRLEFRHCSSEFWAERGTFVLDCHVN